MPYLKIEAPAIVLKEENKDAKIVLRQIGKEVADIARQLIQKTQGAGRQYGDHQASAPGQPPANLTGKLAKSMSLKLNRQGDGITVTDNAFYALALENGGQASKRRGGKDKRGRNVKNWVLEPRPFLSTALDEVAPTASERLGDAILKGITIKRQKP